MKNEIIPVNNKDRMIAEINEAASHLSYKGLPRKAKRFCLAYAGDKISALKAAGYAPRSQREWYRLSYEIMKNPKVRHNITVIDALLARFCVASAVEIKMKISERIRSDNVTDSNLALFGRLLLQTQGELDPKLKLEIESRSHEVREYVFQGPKSAFLESREKASMIEAEVKTLPTPSADDLADIL